MPWNASYRADLDAVMTIYSGVIPAASLQEAVESSLALARRHGTTRFLADCSTLEGGHSIIDLYGLGNLLETAGVARDSREAIVLPQLDAAAKDVRFWEMTCQNRGFNVRVFQTMADASAWLAENHPERIPSQSPCGR